MNRISSFTVLCLLTTLAGSAAAQQDPAEFWQALEESQSLLEISRVPAPVGLDTVVADALRKLRQYELEPVRVTAYRGRWDLERTVRRRPREAWHHLALALVLRRGPDAHVRNSDSKANYHFVDPYSNASKGALRALRRALELDPELELAAIELARFAVERHDRKLLAEAESVLAGMPQTAEVLLERAAIALHRGENDGAVAHADAAARAGADPGRVAHARAVALLRDTATTAAGAAEYMRGLDNASRAALVEYHRTAAPVFFRAEVELWDSLPLERRGSWLREMWELRAALSGVTVEERLGVHFRRLRQAQTLFPLDRPLADAEMLGGAAILTGEELRRHGLTVQGLMLTRSGDPGRIGWLAVCGIDRIPYMPDMEHRLRNGPRMPTAKVLDRMLPIGGWRPPDYIDILNSEDRRRIQEIDCDNPSAILAFTRYIVDGDRYRVRFDTLLQLNVEVYALRGVGSTDLYTAITLPREQLGRVVDASGAVHLETALAVVDTAARRTTRSERAVHFTLPGEAVTHVLLAVPGQTTLHGRLDLLLTVSDPARRAGAVISLPHEVPDFSGSGLMMSDLVIAPAEAADRLRRGSIGLAVAAGRKYRSGESFDLYYEIYGLAAGALYRTRIVLAPEASPLWRAFRQITGTEGDVVALQFEEEAGVPHEQFGTQQLRRITTTSLRPGTYRLQIEITDQASGTTTTRQRLLDIH